MYVTESLKMEKLLTLNTYTKMIISKYLITEIIEFLSHYTSKCITTEDLKINILEKLYIIIEQNVFNEELKKIKLNKEEYTLLRNSFLYYLNTQKSFLKNLFENNSHKTNITSLMKKFHINKFYLMDFQ